MHSTVTEKSFQAAVTQLLDLMGFAWYHTYNSRGSNRGWPDLAICGWRKFILRELKSDRGELTDDQVRWAKRLQDAGQDWAVWRPTDLWSGRIQRELEEIR